MNNIGQIFGGDWTEQKLECVSKYLKAYTKIMNDKPFNFAYIDAFAGTGYRKQDNHDDAALQRFLAGSARRALEVKPPFPKYVFIEANKYSFTELKKLKDEFPHSNIECINNDANESVQQICKETDWNNNRALIFLDPYGMEVEWTTIELIARTKAIDLWVLFPIGMGVSRTLYNNGRIPQSHREKLNKLFGRTDWYNEFYQLTQQLSLFSENNELEKKDDILQKIEQYYLKCLSSVFTFVAENPLPLRNSMNSLMYLLCFAAGNPNASKALDIAKDILERMCDRDKSPQLSFPF